MFHAIHPRHARARALRSLFLVPPVALFGLLAAAPARAAQTNPASTPLASPHLPGLPVPLAPRQSNAKAAVGSADPPLVGLFAITSGSCSSGGVTAGSYFRMISPGGTASGPFVSNSDSPCGDNTYAPLLPGTDGGLSTAGYQPQPNPPFDSSGNGLANRITQPVKFFGVNFAASTNPTDPQTNSAVSVPSVSDNGGTLSGDLRAFSVAYNTQQFNQGSPKPNGSHPGLTAGPTGTYNASSGAFSLDWTSTIVGGPFNNFTGKWHLEGTFRSSGAPSAPASATPAASSPAATTGASPATSGATPQTGSTSTRAAADTTAGTPAAASLPRTGGVVPVWPGLVLLGLGAAMVGVSRRLGEPEPAESHLG